MKQKECSLIQELLPLYAEKLLSEETSQIIQEHLADCIYCTQKWENFVQPLPDPFLSENISPVKDSGSKLFSRLRKAISIAVLVIIIGGAGLVYASYNAGKHIGINDPVYHFAQELNLFTEIEQSKTIDNVQITINKGLFDSTRSVLFITASDLTKIIPQVNLTGENGRQYEMKSAKIWQSKYLMAEFEPLELENEEITVSIALDETEDQTLEFTFPVDMTKTAQYTKIIYPNMQKDLSELKVSLEKAVFGVSESEIKVYFDWPQDGSVAGISIGRENFFPTSVKKVSAQATSSANLMPPPGGIVSNYASATNVYYRPEDSTQNRPALYDLSGRREIEVLEGEYSTTQFPCQVAAILKFAPVKRETELLEVLLPPVYFYKEIKGSSQIYLDFKEKTEQNLEKKLSFSEGEVIIEKAWLEENELCFSYRVESVNKQKEFLPHFKLLDCHKEEQGLLLFDRQKPQVMRFYLYNEDTKEFYLDFDSIGEELPREKFTLDMREK